jgi:hypothetical protein
LGIPTGAIDIADAVSRRNLHSDLVHRPAGSKSDTGVVYRLTERQQVDLQAGFGLNSN